MHIYVGIFCCGRKSGKAAKKRKKKKQEKNPRLSALVNASTHKSGFVQRAGRAKTCHVHPPPFRHPFATTPLARHVTECADTECEIVHGSGLAPFKEHNCHADGGSSSKPKPTRHATAHIHPSTTHTNRDRECNAHRHWGHSMPQGTREAPAVHLPSLVFTTTATSCAVILANS